MSKPKHYLDSNTNPVLAVVAGIDKDVERGEDILMLGYSLVLMAPIFAPIAPPKFLLPLMAITFVVSVCWARINFLEIRDKLLETIKTLEDCDLSALKPIRDIFAEHPKTTLTESFNPLKNLLRTTKSILGALMINPFWMPIFYMLGVQFAEEKQLGLLNKAVIKVLEKTANWH